MIELSLPVPLSCPAVDTLAASALWPDPINGLMRLFLLAVFATSLVMGIRMIRRGAAARRRWRLMQRVAVPAVATVLATREKVHLVDDNGRQWRTSTPTLQFQTTAGQVVTVEGPAVAGSGLVTGTTVPIRYHPQDPSQVDIMRPDTPVDTGSRMLFGGIVVSAFAAALLVGLPIVILASYQP